jgi:hypothetical protein
MVLTLAARRVPIAIMRRLAILRRRRHQLRRPPRAKIKPGSPAPAIGPGTAAMLCSKLVTVAVAAPPMQSVQLIKKPKFLKAPKTSLSRSGK